VRRRSAGSPRLPPPRPRPCPTVDIANLVSSNGITQLNLPWALGGYEYAGTINQIWNGWVGDVRIVNRALSVGEFLTAR